MYIVNLYRSVLDIGAQPEKTFENVLEIDTDDGNIVLKFEGSGILFSENVAVEIIEQVGEDL